MALLIKILNVVPGLMFVLMILTNTIIVITNGRRSYRMTRKLEEAYRSEGKNWSDTNFTLQQLATITNPTALIDGTESPQIFEIKKEMVRQRMFVRDTIMPLCVLIFLIGMVLTALTGIASQFLIGLIKWWQNK